MIENLEKFKEALKLDKELAKQVKEQTIQNIIVLAKAKGYDISKADIEEAIKLKGEATFPTDTIIVWENYLIAGKN